MDPPSSKAVFPPDAHSNDSEILMLCDLEAFLINNLLSDRHGRACPVVSIPLIFCTPRTD